MAFYVRGVKCFSANTHHRCCSLANAWLRLNAQNINLQTILNTHSGLKGTTSVHHIIAVFSYSVQVNSVSELPVLIDPTEGDLEDVTIENVEIDAGDDGEVPPHP